MSDEQVYVTRVHVEDIGGIGQLTADLGSITVVSGDHGTGKSSLLNALDIVFSGGTDPDLIRNGAEKGQVTLTLSDGVTIEKTITRAGSELIILTPEGGKVRRPAEYLKTLSAGFGFDPIGFLASDPKERAEFLLKNLPLTFDTVDVEEAMDGPVIGVGPKITLQKLNELRDAKYSERTELNRKVRDLEGTIADMRRALPPDTGKDWGAERDRIQNEISARDSAIASAKSNIELEAEQRKNENKADTDKVVAELQAKITEAQRAHLEFVSTVDRVAAEAIAAETRTLEVEKSELSIDLGTARANSDSQQQAEGVRNAIEERKVTLAGHISKEMSLTAAIKGLDDLKHRKLKELPIDGLDLKADSKGRPVILIDGIALEKINRQQQLFIAIQAVSLAAGRCPLIICEAAELNDRAVEELGEAAKNAKMQLVLARWSQQGPLAVQAA